MLDAFTLNFVTILWIGVYILILFALALLVKIYLHTQYPNSNYSYFLPLFGVKIFGAFFFAYISVFPLGFEGDTFYYFDMGLSLARIYLTHPHVYFAYVFDTVNHEGVSSVRVWTGTGLQVEDMTNFTIARISSIFIILSKGNFFITNILIATISFLGCWKLVEFFKLIYPKLEKTYILLIFLLPSILFFTSGLLKDTFAFTSISLILYYTYNLIELRKKITFSILMISLGTYILVTIKPYLFFTLCYSLPIWIAIKYAKKLDIFKHRLFFGIILSAILIGMLSLFIYFTNASFSNKSFTIETALGRITAMNEKFPLQANTPISYSSFFKASVDFFAQYHSSILHFNFNHFYIIFWIENIILYILFIQTIVLRPLSFLKSIKEKPILISILLFTISLFLLTFVCAGNLGNIVRLRTPAIASLICTLMIIKNMQKDLLYVHHKLTN